MTPWPEFRKTASDLQIAEYRMERHLLGLDEPEYPVLNRDWARERRYERCLRNLEIAREGWAIAASDHRVGLGG